jgi:predicted amidohydrolase YtcJ
MAPAMRSTRLPQIVRPGLQARRETLQRGGSFEAPIDRQAIYTGRAPQGELHPLRPSVTGVKGGDTVAYQSSRRSFMKSAAAASLSYVIGGSDLMAQIPERPPTDASMILTHGRIATYDARRPFASAVAMRDGRFLAVGTEQEVMQYRTPNTAVLDVGGRTVIPGLNDSHAHPIRGGLHYNLELRWDGVPSLADAFRMLREQARRTPPPQWVQVVGGWSEFQFAERRLPTLDEINAVAPDTPVFVLHLYAQALLNGAALRASGYTKDTPDPPGGHIQRDRAGNPTGLLIAKPNALILYSTLARGPQLSHGDQLNSTRQFMRELNRLGVTSVIDAGGGFQNYPEDYGVIQELHRQGHLTVRLAYNLFTQKPKEELQDFTRWSEMVQPGQGDAYYRMNGAGEMLVFSAADFEDFLEPRPELPLSLEDELRPVIRLLVEKRWPFRIHATYDESIARILDVYEDVNRELPFAGLRWFIDHAETISERNLERVKKLGGGIAVQHRMAFQGEHFVARYGQQAARHAPPVRQMLGMAVPVGAGTDATRVASHNPWVALYWLVAGKTVGGTPLYPESNRLDRQQALRLFTVGSSWFSGEEGEKGSIAPGQLADLAVLSADYFAVPEEQIKQLESVLTIVGGRVVYGSGDFTHLSPAPLPVSPDWSPVATYGGYWRAAAQPSMPRRTHAHAPMPARELRTLGHAAARSWGLGCDCFAF